MICGMKHLLVVLFLGGCSGLDADSLINPLVDYAISKTYEPKYRNQILSWVDYFTSDNESPKEEVTDTPPTLVTDTPPTLVTDTPPTPVVTTTSLTPAVTTKKPVSVKLPVKDFSDLVSESFSSGLPSNLDIHDIRANLDYSSVKATLHNIGNALYDFIDVETVRSFVDIYMDKRKETFLTTNESPISRSDNMFDDSQDSLVREGLVVLIGGVMNKEKCWENLLCGLGGIGKSLPGSYFAFLFLDGAIPASWTETKATINLVKEGMQADCTRYQCGASP